MFPNAQDALPLHMGFSVQPLCSLCNKIAESSFFEKPFLYAEGVR